MPLQDDQTIAPDAVLLRVLRNDPNWTRIDGGQIRPTKLAFFSVNQEISYFVDGPGMCAELERIFPGNKVARIPVSVIREQGFAIERRPGECPEDFQCDRGSHVVAGPVTEMTRNLHQRHARCIANHPEVIVMGPADQVPERDPQV
jgi:hypothetical protein